MIITFASIPLGRILVALGMSVSSVFQGQSTREGPRSADAKAPSRAKIHHTACKPKPILVATVVRRRPLIENPSTVPGRSTTEYFTSDAAPRGQSQSDSTNLCRPAVFGVLPNYRTAEASAPFNRSHESKSLSLRKIHSITRFPIAAFRRPSQLQGSDITHMVHGVKGFAHRYGHRICGSGDPATSSLKRSYLLYFNMDPRYFRKGEGRKGLGWCTPLAYVYVESDSGAITFNSPEVLATHWLALLTCLITPTGEQQAMP